MQTDLMSFSRQLAGLCKNASDADDVLSAIGRTVRACK